MKSSKGITLIALIITIIVMLILVAVTVAVVVNSDLIGTAQGAKTKTEAHAVNDQTYGMNITIKDTLYNSVNDYVNPGSGEDDDIVVIEPNGELILHVFGNKFRISDSTTWEMLDEESDTVNLAPYENLYVTKVNGNVVHNVDDLFASAYDEFDPWGSSSCMPAYLAGTVVPYLNGKTFVYVSDWMGTERLSSLEEIKALEGFEDNSIYIE